MNNPLISDHVSGTCQSVPGQLVCPESLVAPCATSQQGTPMDKYLQQSPKYFNVEKKKTKKFTNKNMQYNIFIMIFSSRKR